VGKVKHLDKLMEFAKGTAAFRARDAELATGNRNYSYLLLHNLLAKNRIKKVVRGWYSVHEDPVVSVFCFKPAYIGLQEALSLHGVWEQETNVVILTARKVRTGIRQIMGSNVILHRIDQRYFFGMEHVKYDSFFIPVSDIEKTMIDLVYFNEIPAREVLREIRRRLDKEKMQGYLKSFPPNFRERVKALL